MKTPQLLQLGPWPKGMNNVADQRSRVFAGSEQAPPQLRAAVNVDINDDGWINRRSGRTLVRPMTDGHSFAYIGGLVLVVDDGNLLRLDPTDLTQGTVLVSGVGDYELSYAAVGPSVYWMSPAQAGVIEGGLARPWGAQTPRFAAGPSTTGGMRAGRYLVAVSTENAQGVESGATVVPVELGSDGGIQFTFQTLDPDAARINLYASETNGKTPFWQQTIPLLTDYNLVAVGLSTDPLRTAGLHPPPLGQIVRGYRGRVLVAKDSALYWSQPLAYHQFKLATDVQLFSDRVVLLEPIEGGFYVATNRTTWWVSGDDPEAWTPREIDNHYVFEGAALRVPSHLIAGLESGTEVPVWATDHGLVAGLPGGQIKHLTYESVAMDRFSSARFGLREENGLRQIITSLQDRRGDNTLAAVDKMEARVIRAGESTGQP